MNTLFLVAIFIIATYLFDVLAIAVKAKANWIASFLFAGACTVVAAKYLL